MHFMIRNRMLHQATVDICGIVPTLGPKEAWDLLISTAHIYMSATDH